MAFKTLEQRFNESSTQIYNRFQPSRDQLVSIKPDTRGVFGSRSRIKNDTQALPVTSFIRDTKRLTNFLKSPEGLLYIGKQVLLQTGNVFKESRIYNPLSNYQIPNLLRIKRIIGGDDTPKGLLQPDTISQFTGTKKPPVAAQSVLVKFNYNETPGRPEINTFGPNYSPFLRGQPVLAERSQKKSNILDSSGLLFDVNNKAFDFGILFRLKAQGAPTIVTAGQVKRNSRLKKKFEDLTKKFDTDKAVGTDFYMGNNTRGYGATLRTNSGLFEEDAPRTSNTFPEPPVNSTGDFIKPYDALNAASFGTFGKLENGVNKIDYDRLVPEKATQDSTTPDIINFTFQAQGTPDPVKFRAFISTFKQTVKPEFAEQKYLGRTERFVSYGGAKRTATLSFNIVAFSKIELDTVWTKVNYLTGLAFPLGVSNSGFLVPPLFKISVGNIYDAQPCYMENLDFDFIDKDITFDIDNEVSQFVNVNMSIVLLEKRSRFYDSPFYQITEDLANQV